MSLIFNYTARADVIEGAPQPAVANGTAGSVGALPEESWLSPFNIRLPIQYGPFEFHPRFSYHFLQADGVQSQPGVERSTSVQGVTLGLQINAGPQWDIEYDARWTFYSEESLDDNVSQSARLSGHTAHENWTASISHFFGTTDTTLIETGAQTEQQNHSTHLTWSRGLWNKFGLEIGLNQNLRFAEGYADARERNMDDWLVYQATPWLQTSAGFSYGRGKSEGGPTSTNTRYTGRVNIRVSEKLGLQAQAGVGYREYDTPLDERRRSPVYSAALIYRIFEPTTLKLIGDRGMSASYFQNRINRSERWRIVLSQRVLVRYIVTLDATRRKNRLESIVGGAGTSRKDEGTGYRGSISTSVRTRGSVAVFYARFKNKSTDRPFAFVSNQFGLDFSYRL